MEKPGTSNPRSRCSKGYGGSSTLPPGQMAPTDAASRLGGWWVPWPLAPALAPPSALEWGSDRAQELGKPGRVPVGNPVGMRLGSHVSRGRGGGCGSGGRDRSGLARGPCSTLGPPRAASSRARPLGPAEALSARQGPGRRLPEWLSARCSAEGEATGVRGAAGARGLERAGGGRGSPHRRRRVSRPRLSPAWQPPPRPWPRPD